LPERTRAQRRAEGPALIAELRALRDPDHPPYEPSLVTVPVVAAHGTESVTHHRETARALAAEAPDAELVTVEGASHGVHLSHPAELARLARLALERAERAGR
jgi:pimeloyl-ACP methyl ester carboxylesterase